MNDEGLADAATASLSFAKLCPARLMGVRACMEGSRRWRLVRGPKSVSLGAGLTRLDTILRGHPERSGRTMGAAGVSRGERTGRSDITYAARRR
jgi:hypothetical protein